MNAHLVEGLRRNGVNVGSSYISQIENKGKIPSAEILVGLAKSLDTTTDYLLLLSDEPTRSNSTELTNYYSSEADRIAQQVDAMPEEARQFCLVFVQQFSDHQARLRNAEHAALMGRLETLVGRDQARRIDAALGSELTGGTNGTVTG